MRAMALVGVRQMEIIDVPDVKIVKETDVLIRIGCVGVCGSDVHYYVSGNIGSMIVEYPFVLGHECAGVVEAVGSAVENVKTGDRVAIDPAISCFKCDQCKAGRHHTCRELRFLGCPGQAQGCMSEYIVMQHQCCFKIPDTMTLEQAVISEPLAIGLYAVKCSVPMRGAKIAILGAGPIGLSVLLPARAQGAAEIYVTDKIDERIALAKSCGAHWGGNVDKIDIVHAINQAQPQQLDVVYECCGEQEALDQAIEILKPGGKLMLIGIPAVDRVSFIIENIRRKEICIQNIRRQVDCVLDALELMGDKDFGAEAMITHRFKFEQTPEAMDLVADYKDGVVKAMIDFGIE